MAVKTNTKNKVLVSGTSSDDSIYSYGSKVTISGGKGNDYIQNFGGSNVSIYGGAGSDSIYNTFANSSDFSTGKNVTINGGLGNDSIASASNGKTVFEYDIGGGHDVIYGYNSNETLQINSSSYSTMVSGNDFIVFVGTGSITLKNSANVLVKIRNSSGKLRTYNTNPINVLSGTILDDEILNTNSNASVLGFAGNDNIVNNADEVLLFGQEDNDIIISAGYNNTIAGFEGNDSILSYGDNCELFGFEGNDTIIAQGEGNTIIGGYDNDFISLDSANGGNIVLYGYGCGNDTVYGVKTNDTLNLYNGYVSEVSVSGSNVIAKVGDDTFTGVNLKGKIINITDWAGGDYSVRVDSKDLITLFATDKTTDDEVLSSLVKNFDASKRTTAIKITGNKLANTIKGGSKADTILGGAGADKLYGNAGDDSVLGGDGNDTLWGGAGADKLYGNAGNDSILGGDDNDLIKGQAGDDKLYGNAGNDKLYGGNDKDSLWGGAGNDTLWGGNGKDVFTFLANNGTDYIMDYESGELLRIYNAAGTKTTSFSKSAFSNDTLTLTINDGGTIILNDVDKTTKFNINGTDYKVSGSKLAKG